MITVDLTYVNYFVDRIDESTIKRHILSPDDELHNLAKSKIGIELLHHKYDNNTQISYKGFLMSMLHPLQDKTIINIIKPQTSLFDQGLLE